MVLKPPGDDDDDVDDFDEVADDGASEAAYCASAASPECVSVSE